LGRYGSVEGAQRGDRLEHKLDPDDPPQPDDRQGTRPQPASLLWEIRAPPQPTLGKTGSARRGSRDFEEGLFMCFRINDEVIILDALNTTGGVLRTLAVLCTQQRWSRVCGHQRCQMARPQPVVVYPCLSGQLVGRDSARGLAAAARGRKWSAAQGPGG
jgi:hypothetical protein